MLNQTDISNAPSASNAGNVSAMPGKGRQLQGKVPASLDQSRFDAMLAELVDHLSRARVQALIKQGHATLDGKPVKRGAATVLAGQQWAIEIPQPIADRAIAEQLPLNIVYEDDELLLVDKPAGLVVHPAAGHARGTLVNGLLHHCAGKLSGIGGVYRPGIVHRIDKDTSGLLVVAKSDAAHQGLARQFADHTIQRRYLALVGGKPKQIEGTIKGNIGRSAHNRKKMAVLDEGRGKYAVTHYRLIEPFADAALIECRLETGRTHQVRVHMAHIGHGLIGDPVYGTTPKPLRDQLKPLKFRRQALHAESLGFIHPIKGREMQFSSPIPEDIQEILRLFRAD